jgi:hypothetical protein
MKESGNGSADRKSSDVRELWTNKLPAPTDIRIREVTRDASLNQPIGPDILAAIGEVRRPKVPVKARAFAYSAYSTEPRLREPEYDLREVIGAVSMEALLRLSIQKHTDKIKRSGWEMQGNDTATKSYVFRRLREIEIATQEPINVFFTTALNSLVKLSNAFIHYIREDVGTGRTYRDKFGREVGKIKGLEIVPAEMMGAFTDQFGNIQRWEQHVRGTAGVHRSFRPLNILHIYHERLPKFVFGTPYIVDVLEDIKMMRRTEENEEIKNHKAGYPWIHGKVGSDERPAQQLRTGGSEIIAFRNKIRDLDYEGFIVTDHRHAIEAVDISGAGLDLMPFLEHAKWRVLAGLGIQSPSEAGPQNTTRQVELELSATGLERAESFAATFGEFITLLFDELLFEGGFRPTPDNRVFFTYRELNQIQRMIIENHVLAQAQGNLITLTEARKMAGRDPLTKEQENDLYFELFTKPVELIRAQKAASDSSGSGNGSPRAVSTRNQPRNQSGKKMARTSTVNASAERIGALVSPVWPAARPSSEEASRLVDRTAGLLLDLAYQTSREGAEAYQEESGQSFLFVSSKAMASFGRHYLHPRIRSALDSLAAGREVAVQVLADSLADCSDRAFEYGYVWAAQQHGKSSFAWVRQMEDGAVDSREAEVGDNGRIHPRAALAEDGGENGWYLQAMDRELLTRETYYEQVQKLIRMSHALRTGKPDASLSDGDFIYGGTIPCYDEASAYNVAAFMSSDNGLSKTTRGLIQNEYEARLEKLKLTHQDLTDHFQHASQDWMDSSWGELQDIADYERSLAADESDITEDAKLTTTARKKLPASAFCGPAKSFPAHDAPHVRNALARLPQSKLTPAQKASVLSCLRRKAKRLGVKVSADAKQEPVDNSVVEDAVESVPASVWDGAADALLEKEMLDAGRLPCPGLTDKEREDLPAGAYCGPNRSFPGHTTDSILNSLVRLPQSRLSPSQKLSVLARLREKAASLGVKISADGLDSMAGVKIDDDGTWVYVEQGPVRAWERRVSNADGSLLVRWDTDVKLSDLGGMDSRHVLLDFYRQGENPPKVPYHLLLGTDNEIRQGSKKSDKAVYISPTSFKLLSLEDGAYRLRLWLSGEDGSVGDGIRHESVFVVDSTGGFHDEFGPGGHRHSAGVAADGDHPHPHPSDNPFGLHKHAGQKEMTGAHTHGWGDFGGGHPFETPGLEA